MPEEGAPSPFGGMRMFLIIGAVAVIAYLFIRSRSSASSAGAGGTSTGGGGTISSSGTTTLQKGAVTVTVTQQPQTAAAAGGSAAGTGGSTGTGGTSSGGTTSSTSTGGPTTSNPQPSPPDRDRRHTTSSTPSGSVSAVIPKVTGMSFDQAKAALQNAGFNIGGGAVQKGYAGSVIITSQTPGAGQTETQGKSQYWGANSSKPTVDLG